MERKKNIIMVFGKPRKESDPFWDFKNKRSVYYYYFKHGHKMGHNMFLSNGLDMHDSSYTFINPLMFDGKKFIHIKKTVIADYIFDRSASLKFPTSDINKVLNPINFKLLCASKIEMYKLLHRHMPKTYFIRNNKELEDACKKITNNNMYVLKPSNGLGGKDILFDTAKNLTNQSLKHGKDYILQEFIDTSSGIPSITKNRHDLRIVVLNNEVVWMTLRTPKGDNLLANVAQGGQIIDITNVDLPDFINELISTTQEIIKNNYSSPLLYSIDIGVEHDNAYIFELNDQIGFPTEQMPSCKLFINKLLTILSN